MSDNPAPTREDYLRNQRDILSQRGLNLEVELAVAQQALAAAYTRIAELEAQAGEPIEIAEEPAVEWVNEPAEAAAP